MSSACSATRPTRLLCSALSKKLANPTACTSLNESLSEITRKNAFSADLQQRRRSYVKQPASILHQDSKTTPTNTLRLDQTCGSATRKGLRDVKSLHLHSYLCGERFIGLSRPTASRKVLKYLVDKTMWSRVRYEKNHERSVLG